MHNGDEDGRTELRYEDVVEFIEICIDGDIDIEGVTMDCLKDMVKAGKKVWPRIDWDSAFIAARSQWP